MLFFNIDGIGPISGQFRKIMNDISQVCRNVCTIKIKVEQLWQTASNTYGMTSL